MNGYKKMPFMFWYYILYIKKKRKEKEMETKKIKRGKNTTAFLPLSLYW